MKFLLMALTCFFCFLSYGVELYKKQFTLNFSGETHYKTLRNVSQTALVMLEFEMLSEEPSGSYTLKVNDHSSRKLQLESNSDSLDFSLHSYNVFSGFRSLDLQATKDYEFTTHFDSDQNQVLTFPLLINIPKRQIVKPGTYQTSLDIKLTSPDCEVLIESSIFINTKIAEENLIEFESPKKKPGHHTPLFALDFGEILSTSSKTLRFCVYSNHKYNICLQSKNQGYLSHEKLDCKIPYELSFNETILNMKKSEVIALKNSLPTSKSGQACKLNLTVMPNPKHHFSGKYTEELILSIKPLF